MLLMYMNVEDFHTEDPHLLLNSSSIRQPYWITMLTTAILYQREGAAGLLCRLVERLGPNSLQKQTEQCAHASIYNKSTQTHSWCRMLYELNNRYRILARRQCESILLALLWLQLQQRSQIVKRSQLLCRWRSRRRNIRADETLWYSLTCA